MRIRHLFLVVAALPVLGCIASDGGADPAGSGKADVAANGEEFDCVIVEVVGDDFGGAIGSIYDYDSDGLPGVDGDAVRVGLMKFDQSELKSKLLLSVGQMSSIGFDKGDKLKRIKAEGVITWEGSKVKEEATEFNENPAEPTVFVVRIIEALGVGWLHVKNESGELDDIAKLDCRGVERPDFDSL
jgi:hypothetical protein